MPDRIRLRDLEVEALIGVHAWERRTPRPLRVDLDLACDARAAAASDRLAHAVDYSAVAARVRQVCAASRRHLLEALAGDIAEACLEDTRVAEVTVTVHKPGAVERAGDVSVTLTRGR